jgi:hypothetical protein
MVTADAKVVTAASRFPALGEIMRHVAAGA